MTFIIGLGIWLVCAFIFAVILFCNAQEKEIKELKRAVDTLDMVCDTLEHTLKDVDEQLVVARKALRFIEESPSGSRIIATIALHKLALVNNKETH